MNRLCYLAILFASSSLSACSLLVSFTECESDSDCEAGSCVDGICDVAEPTEENLVVIDFNIGEDTTWTKDNIYVLDTVVSVAPSVTLEIEAGTEIRGERGSALVVRDGGQMIAIGTREEPIVFTSAQPVGQRFAGDWGGIALLGKAPVNRPDAFLNIVPDAMIAGRFGGSDPTWNCGDLEYVRVEFGGGQVAGEEALNGLTFAGCGTETTAKFIQIHFGADDGLELFGGTMNLNNIVVTRAQDDSVDIDLGWVGTLQYLAVVQDIAGENAIEVDNLQETPDATPLTDFQIYNYTLVAADDGPQRGITIKAGGQGFFSHGVMVGHGAEALDVFGPEAGDRALAGDLIIQKTLFFDIGPGGMDYFPVAGTPGESQPDGTGDDDNGFDEASFANEEFDNRFGVDPDIDRSNALTNPDWIPSGQTVSGPTIGPPPIGFDQTANFMGGFAPGNVPWTDGWTAYPAN